MSVQGRSTAGNGGLGVQRKMASHPIEQGFTVVPTRIFLPVVLTVVLFVITIFMVILPTIETHLMARKREMVRQLTEVALGTLRVYADMEATGRLTRSEAQRRAIDHLRQLRYGPESKDYFWINDMHPVLLMHPYRPDLEGKDISGYADPDGKHLFVAFVNTVRSQGDGFVDYRWQWHDEPGRIVPKVSYVKGFPPWGWIAGTGMYTDDVRSEISAITRRTLFICLGILTLLVGLSAYIVRQGIVSERVRQNALDALRRSEKTYRLLAETAREFILTADPTGAVTYANRAWLAAGGFAEGELTGRGIADLFSADHRDRIDVSIHGLGNDGAARDLESMEMITKAGGRIPVEVTCTPFTDPEGVAMALITARDITEKNRAEQEARHHREQLFQADKMATLGTLVSGVAHEINNPITLVLLNAPLLTKAWEGAVPILDAHQEAHGDFRLANLPYPTIRDRMPRLLADVTGGARRVKAIVGDLKDFARHESPDMTDTIDINAVTRAAVGLVSHLVRKTTGRFSADYGRDIPLFSGNARRIEQVVVNLLVNACQATDKPQGTISVVTDYDRSSDSILVAVSDQGLGMSDAVLQRIRDPFFTTKRESGGTGLGLAICDRIVEDHGGSLSFSSQPGEGTTALVHFPANPGNGPAIRKGTP